MSLKETSENPKDLNKAENLNFNTNANTKTNIEEILANIRADFGNFIKVLKGKNKESKNIK